MVVAPPVPSKSDQATTALVGFGVARHRNKSCWRTSPSVCHAAAVIAAAPPEGAQGNGRAPALTLLLLEVVDLDQQAVDGPLRHHEHVRALGGENVHLVRRLGADLDSAALLLVF